MGHEDWEPEKMYSCIIDLLTLIGYTKPIDKPWDDIRDLVRQYKELVKGLVKDQTMADRTYVPPVIDIWKEAILSSHESSPSIDDKTVRIF